MNILWIEDFGGEADQESMLLDIFKELIHFSEKTLSEINKLDLGYEPELLTNIIATIPNNLHTIWLRGNYHEYAALLQEKKLMQEIDLVLLDIGLADDPEETQTFLKQKDYDRTKGGLFIYNELIHKRYPKEHICFLTGQESDFTAFEKACKSILLPDIPKHVIKKAISESEKDKNTYPELRQWLSNKAQNPYITLRRGIISACQSIRTLIEQYGVDKIQFKEFLKDKPENSELVTNMRDYLETLEKFLPIVEPTDKARYYKLFVRTLAHEWEDNANPNHLKQETKTQKPLLRATGYVMKQARNALAHNGITGEFDEKTIALLFMFAMRSMFQLAYSNIENHEQILFSLFENPLSESEIEEKKKQRDFPLLDFYAEIQHKFWGDLKLNKAKLQADKVLFERDKQTILINAQQDFFKLFWQEFIQVKQVSAEKTIFDANQSNSISLKMNYELDLNGFYDALKEQDAFLMTLTRHIYNYSF